MRSSASFSKSLLLSHFGTETDKTNVKAIARKNFKGRIYAAKDLMKVSI